MRGGVIEVPAGMLAEAATRGRRVQVRCPNASRADWTTLAAHDVLEPMRACDLEVCRLPTGDFVGRCPEHGTIAVDRSAGRHVAWLAAAHFGGWEPADEDEDPEDDERPWVFDREAQPGPDGIACTEAHLVAPSPVERYRGVVSLWCCPVMFPTEQWISVTADFVTGDYALEPFERFVTNAAVGKRYRVRPCERCVANRSARLARTTDVDWADAAVLLAEGPR